MSNEKLVIQKTQDYSAFKLDEANREVKAPHVRRLKESINKNPRIAEFSPILVNQDMVIIDGQHRFAALRLLHMPVWYIQYDGLTVSDAQDMNSGQRPWRPVDYAESYCRRGNKNYCIYCEARRKFGLNHDILMKYLSIGGHCTGESFRVGNLEVKNKALSFRLMQQLCDFAEFYPRYNIRNFALGYLSFCQTEGYNHEHMLSQVRRHSALVGDGPLPEDFVKTLETVYNA